MLVFEDAVVQTEHYAMVHREKRTVPIAFGFSLRDEEEEETKVISRVPTAVPYRYEAQEEQS